MFNKKGNEFDVWSFLAGILFVCAAVLIFLWPFATFQALVVIIGIVALCIGLYHFVLHSQLAKNFNESGYLVIFNGCIDIIIGIFLLFSKYFGFWAIAIAFAIWFIVDSILDIRASTKAQKKEPKSYYWLIVTAGVIGVIIGIALLFLPFISNAIVVIFIGIYFVIEGIKLIVRSF